MPFAKTLAALLTLATAAGAPAHAADTTTSLAQPRSTFSGGLGGTLAPLPSLTWDTRAGVGVYSSSSFTVGVMPVAMISLGHTRR